nr:MAG TPA: hypothetical protein [Bacteriophage sp.]
MGNHHQYHYQQPNLGLLQGASNNLKRSNYRLL